MKLTVIYEFVLCFLFCDYFVCSINGQYENVQLKYAVKNMRHSNYNHVLFNGNECTEKTKEYAVLIRSLVPW